MGPGPDLKGKDFDQGDKVTSGTNGFWTTLPAAVADPEFRAAFQQAPLTGGATANPEALGLELAGFQTQLVQKFAVSTTRAE